MLKFKSLWDLMESNSEIVKSWPDWMRGAPACPEHPGGCRSACIEKRKSAKVEKCEKKQLK